MGWVFPRGGSGSLRCAPTVCRLRFFVFFVFRGRLVDSRWRQRARRSPASARCTLSTWLSGRSPKTSTTWRVRALGFFVERKRGESATHSGSAQGAFRGLVFCLASSCGFLLCFLPLLASLGCRVFGAVRACFGFGFRVSFPTALLLGELMTRTEIASRLLIKGRRPTRAFSSPRHLG